MAHRLPATRGPGDGRQEGRVHRSKTYSFTVTGMHCGSCAMLIDEAIEEAAGVHRSQTSVRAGRTVVEVDVAIAGPDTLLAVIESLGYTARLDPP